MHRCNSCRRPVENMREFFGYHLCRQCFRQVREMVARTGESYVVGEMAHEDYVTRHASRIA